MQTKILFKGVCIGSKESKKIIISIRIVVTSREGEQNGTVIWEGHTAGFQGTGNVLFLFLHDTDTSASFIIIQ